MPISSRRRDTLQQRAREMRHAPTSGEARLFAALHGKRLGVSFRRQVVLAGRFIVDLYAAEARLIVEVDGGYHGDRIEHDARRDRALRALGYRVLRIDDDLVLTDLSEALRGIQLALVET